MVIKIDSLVKWQVGEGFGYAKVTELSDDLVKVQLPSGQLLELEQASLEVISDEEYSEAVIKLVNKLIKHIGEGYMTLEEAQAKIAELESALSEKDAAVAKELEAKEALVAEKAELSKELETVKANFDKVESQLREIEKEQVIASRVSELGEAFIKDAFKVSSVSEASEQLFSMPTDTYNLFKNMSEAFNKLTEQTLTNLPKSTEQNETTLPQSTEQTLASEEEAEAVANATLETDVDLSAVASIGDDSFKNAIAEVLKN